MAKTKMVKFIFEDGREVEMREEIAQKYEAKGKGKIQKTTSGRSTSGATVKSSES